MKSNRLIHGLIVVMMVLWFTGCATDQSAVQTPPPEPAQPVVKPSVIEKITFQEEEKYTRVLVVGSEPIDLPFYKLLTDPLRIAIDIPNADLGGIREPLKIDNGTIGDVVATQYDGKGRIEIGLTRMANYNVSKEDRVLSIDVEKVKEETKGEGRVQVTEVAPKEVKKEEPVTAPAAEPSPAPAAPKALPQAKAVTDLTMEQKEGAVTFKVVADGTLGNYNAFALEKPARLVLDVWNVDVRYPKRSFKSPNPFVQKVRIGKHADKIRLVFDSSTPKLPPYAVTASENTLLVSFGKVSQPSEPQVVVQESGQAAAASTPAAASGKRAVLTRIDFKQMDHRSRVAIGTTGEPLYESQMVSRDILLVTLKNTFVPKHLQRALDTKEFESAVEYISIQNIKSGKVTDVRISLKLREEVPYEVTREGKDIFVDVEEPKRVGAKREEKVAESKPEEVTKKEEKPAPTVPVTKEVPPAESKEMIAQERKTTAEGPSKVYTGRKISLDFKDADIKNILRLIAEVSNLNIIAGDDVSGKITMRLVDVPWDQALDVVLQARNLGMTRVGNVIRVAPQDSLKKELQSELEARRAKEKLEDLATELLPVNYASAKEIAPQVKSVLSDRGDVKVDERTNILIVKDIAGNVVLARDLVKSLDSKTPQVLIEARILEASTSFQRELGVSWGFTATGGMDDNNNNLTVKGGSSVNRVVDLPAVARAGAGGALGTAGILEFIFTSIHGLRELDIAISAHEIDGTVKIISSPKIATLDNKEASIEQGLRIPYLKLTSEGTVTTEFIDANLKLTVTPHVTADGNIKMNLKVRKDRPDLSITVQGVPSIDKKEAISEVLVKDNGVVVIGGIYEIDREDSMEGVPLFNRIPLLGWLFKREAKSDTRKDLIIFISPKIIKDRV
jgi:type IV pilus assembly protein PilQ